MLMVEGILIQQSTDELKTIMDTGNDPHEEENNSQFELNILDNETIDTDFLGQEIILFFEAKYINPIDQEFKNRDCFVTVFKNKIKIEILSLDIFDNNCAVTKLYEFDFDASLITADKHNYDNTIVINLDYADNSPKIILKHKHWSNEIGTATILDRFRYFQDHRLIDTSINSSAIEDNLGKVVLKDNYFPKTESYGNIFLTENEIYFVFDKSKDYYRLLLDPEYEIEYNTYTYNFDESPLSIQSHLRNFDEIADLPHFGFFKELACGCNISKDYTKDYTVHQLDSLQLLVSLEQSAKIEAFINQHSSINKQYKSDLEEIILKDVQIDKIKESYRIRDLHFGYIADAKQKYLYLKEQEDVQKWTKGFIHIANSSLFLVPERYLENIESIARMIDSQELYSADNTMSQEYDKYFQIISRKYNDIAINPLVIWYLHKEAAKEYFFEYFINKYSEFEKKQASLEDYILSYMGIDTIDPTDIFNVSVFTYFLMNIVWINDHEGFPIYFEIVEKEIIRMLEEKELRRFESMLVKPVKKQTVTITNIDLMGGQEFEYFVADLFQRMGYVTEVTKQTGDQGIDIIARRPGTSIGIQTKCYSQEVSNKAVQEVTAGLGYYNLDKGIVVTNHYYTKSAVELANSNGIILWDRNMLKEKINELF